MAEFVEQKIQEMVPEIEEMERTELLSSDEIKKLIQKRRDFEYKVCKPKKEKQNFVNYVLFDTRLLELITLRRQKILMFKKFHSIEVAISQRVVRRLRLMSRLWPSHPDIWKLRISFLKWRKCYDELSSAYAEQIRYHGDDENVWVAWAQWEMEGRKNFEKARSILLSRAPLYHPHSFLITKEYFRLELLYIEFLKKKAETTNVEGLEEVIAENREQVLHCGVPEVIYRNALKEFDSNSELFLEFYSIAHQFPFAHRLRDKIYNDLVVKFPNDQNVWRLRAKMLLEGIEPRVSKEEDQDKTEGENEDNQETEKPKLSSKEKLKKLFDLYDEALSCLGRPFLECFLQDLFNLLHEVWGVDEFVAMVTKKLLAVCEANSAHLTTPQFLFWHQLALELKLDSKKLEEIIEIAASVRPDCPLIKLHHLNFSLQEENIASKKRMIDNLSGKMAADICMKIISQTKVELQKSLFSRACNHPEANLSKEMRIRQMETFEGSKDYLDKCRAHYKKYSSLPPFCLCLHTTMLEKELARKPFSISHVRQVLDVAMEQFGRCDTGLWLCYVEFEKKCGDTKRASHLSVDVEAKLDPKLMNEFIDRKFALESSLAKKEPADKSTVLVDCPEEDQNDLSQYEFWTKSHLPPLFEEEPSLMYSAVEERKKFFASLAAIQKQVDGDSKEEKSDLKVWEKLLSLIHGSSISLEVKRVSYDEIGTEKEVQDFIEEAESQFKQKIIKGKEALSDKLHLKSRNEKPSAGVSGEIKKILENSQTLKPEFLQQKQIIPYYLNKKSVKKLRKKDKSETAGEGWFNMKAPELTDEVKRDLKILKMRSILDPHRHYKRNDMKKLPKFFQMGKVVETAQDFYSSRLMKKDRKTNMAEEIMNDENVLRYQKRKYSEIIEKKESKRRKRAKIQKELGSKKDKKKGKPKAKAKSK